MFTSILFLILVTLIIAEAPLAKDQIAWLYPPQEAFLIGFALYLIVLILIYAQNRIFKKGLYIIANLELLLFLLCFYYLLGSARILESYPPFSHSDAFLLLFGFLLYFIGLGVFHYSASSHLQSTLKELRFLIPFVLPFFLTVALFDLIVLIPGVNQYLALAMVVVALIILVIYMPAIIQKVWQCQMVTVQPLKDRLENLCHRAHFKHAGLMEWSILNPKILTAAIVGIIPRYRYVMFTPRVLNEMPPNQIEAILAHEIGHSKHRHLLLYPLIFIGLSIVIGLLGMILDPLLHQPFPEERLVSPLWQFLDSVFALLIYGTIIAVFFRFIFGFFSRLFEREADLYIFDVGIPAQDLIDAFDHIAVATGNTHHHPSWHHYSIQERIDFLREVETHRELIEKHHRQVKYWLWAYFGIVLLLSLIIVINS